MAEKTEQEQPGTTIAEREPTLAEAIGKVRKRKRKLSKAKRAAEEITYLNIVAMVDVLTILLIFLLKSVSVSSTVATTADLALPFSTTQQLPIEAVKVFVTRDKIIVEDKMVAEVANGAIDSKKLSPSNQYLIPSVRDALTNWIKWELLFKKAKVGQLNIEILADKDTPYHLLMQVLYSAGKAEHENAGKSISFSKYRLMVMRAAT